MSREIVSQVIRKFLSSHNPEVLAITGDWGVGKTYAIRDIVNKFEGESALKKYSYVSLFGLHSIVQLRSAIFLRSEVFPYVKWEKCRLKRYWNSIKGWIFNEKIRSSYSHAKELIPYGGKHVVAAMEVVAGSFVKNTIVCFDDLERLGSGIKIEDFLGLVSELKEQLNCKIIIILNEKQLESNESKFTKYSEKIIDQKLSFSITASDAISLGLPEKIPLRELVVQNIINLDITNIRVIQKISKALSIIYPLIDTHTAGVKKRAASIIPIFAAVLYESARGFPSLNEALAYNVYSNLRKKTVDRTTEQTQKSDLDWTAMFELCNFKHADEFDRAILLLMQNGFSDGSLLVKYANERDALHNRDALAEIYTESWNLFHDRFDVTSEQLADSFLVSVKQAAITIAPLNINSAVVLIRSLGLEEKADEIIETYIKLHQDTPSIFDPKNWFSHDDITDPGMRKRFSECLTASSNELTLQQAADMIIANDHWDDAIARALSIASPDGIVELLMNNQGSNLSRLIQGIQNPPVPLEVRAVIQPLITEALEKIGRSSPLNAIQVNRYGVDVKAASATFSKQMP
ncbi:MAG: hypothetical protein JWQ10_1346 [Herbaspirillum sp.]|nr:hypothetical protein [Herbaspirillum sp.]